MRRAALSQCADTGMREDMAEINGPLDGVEPQQMRQKFRHVGEANAAKIVRGCWPINGLQMMFPHQPWAPSMRRGI
jgi:hypothetical protein